MSWLIGVAVLGFDLERGRQLAHDNPPPPSTPPTPPHPPSPPPTTPPYAGCDYSAGGRSCDEDLTNECDEQSEDGSWDRSCDVHPSKSCDDWSHCKYPPPPPLAPAPPGGYSPPPEPPPEDALVPRIIGWSAFGVVVGLLLLGCCAMRQYRSARRGTGGRGALHSTCCCFIECCRRSNWHQGEHNGHGVPHGEETPQMLGESELRERSDRLVKAMERDVRVAAALMPPLHLGVGSLREKV